MKKIYGRICFVEVYVWVALCNHVKSDVRLVLEPIIFSPFTFWLIFLIMSWSLKIISFYKSNISYLKYIPIHNIWLILCVKTCEAHKWRKTKATKQKQQRTATVPPETKKISSGFYTEDDSTLRCSRTYSSPPHCRSFNLSPERFPNNPTLF